MEKLKEFWRKLKYWQRGGLFGLVFGVLLNIYLYTNQGVYDSELISIGNFHLGDLAFHLVPLFLYAFIFDSTINSSINLINLTMVILWYILLGILFGLVFKYLKQKYSKHIILLFIVLLILFFIIVYFINFIILILLLSKAA